MADRTYRIGVIGSTGRGDYGHGLDVMWKDVPGCEVVAVADDNPGGLKEAARRLSVKETFGDYRQMLDQAKPQIVAIGPRWIDRHCEMATEAAQRGIHIFMEKPFCRTLEEADKILRACEMTHAKLALAHQTRYSPKVPVVKRLLDEGHIGKVLEFRGRGKEDQRGGAEDLWVLGSHIMNLAATLGGAPRRCYAQLFQDGRPVTTADVKEGNEGIGPIAGDTVHASFELELAPFTFSSIRNAAGNPSRFGLQILGSKGVIEILTGYLPSVKILQDSSWSPGRSGTSWKDVSSAGIDKPEPLSLDGLHGGNVVAARDLIDAIENHREPLCNGNEGRQTIEMITAVFASHRTGGPVAFPLTVKGQPLKEVAGERRKERGERDI